MQERWETWPEIQHLCGLANAPVSKDQLERWRLKGLLPKVNQVGKGRGAGSETRFPVGTTNQAIAIVELLSVKEKLSFVGWQLWMRGFDVDQRYWKAEIDNAIFQLKRTPAYVRLLETQFLSVDKTVYDELSPNIFQHSPFAMGIGKLSPDMRALALSLLGGIAKGQFSGFASNPNDDPKLNIATISKFIGFPIQPSVDDIIPKPEFEADFELQLTAISNVLRDLRRNRSLTIEKIAPDVRIKFLAVLAIAGNLQLTVPAFRKSPFGKFSTAIAKDQKIQAVAVVLWSIFQEMETIQSSDKIVELVAMFNPNIAN